MFPKPPVEAVIYDDALRVLTTVIPKSNPQQELDLTIKLDGKELDLSADTEKLERSARNHKSEKHRPYLAVYHIQQHLARALRTASSGLSKKVHVYRQTAREGGLVVNRFMFVPGAGMAQTPRRLSLSDFRTAAMVEY